MFLSPLLLLLTLLWPMLLLHLAFHESKLLLWSLLLLVTHLTSLLLLMFPQVLGIPLLLASPDFPVLSCAAAGPPAVAFFLTPVILSLQSLLWLKSLLLLPFLLMSTSLLLKLFQMFLVSLLLLLFLVLQLSFCCCFLLCVFTVLPMEPWARVFANAVISAAGNVSSATGVHTFLASCCCQRPFYCWHPCCCWLPAVCGCLCHCWLTFCC
jgi:hypothetical protein